MTEQEFEEHLRKLNELNRKIIIALEKAKKDYNYIYFYEKAVKEYEDEKQRLYEELQK